MNMNDKMLKVYVNGVERFIKIGSNVYQACQSLGVYLPRFCYHEELIVAGNCRICIVELEGYPKPIPGCSIPRMEGIKIYTDTPKAKKAREGVIEMRLRNHPLDCPICDQAGECDLQDQAIEYGTGKSRIWEYKRGVEDKDIGLVIKTVITRCIHCTRCIRYASEISDLIDRGIRGRGRNSEIGRYVNKIDSNNLIIGNLEEICPVGARLNKEGGYTKRDWEIKDIISVDSVDNERKEIRMKIRGNDLIEIKPVGKGEWISDKTRFSRDGRKQIRRDSVYTCNGERVSLEEGREYRKNFRINGTKKRFVRGGHVDSKRKLIRKERSKKGVLKVSGVEGSIKTREYEGEIIHYNTKDLKGNRLILGCDRDNENPMMKLILKGYDINIITYGVEWKDIKEGKVNELGLCLNDRKSFVEGRHIISKYIKHVILGKKILINEGKIEIYNIIKQINPKYVSLMDNQGEIRDSMDSYVNNCEERVIIGVSKGEMQEGGKTSRLNKRKDKVKVVIVETANNIIETEGRERMIPRKTGLESSHIRIGINGEVIRTKGIFDSGFNFNNEMCIISDKREEGEVDVCFDNQIGVCELKHGWINIGMGYRYNYRLEGHPRTRGSKYINELSIKANKESIFK